MNSNEARTIVQTGLERRREERNEAAQERRLEAYEKQMIRHCNEHCADEKAIRKLEEAARLNREQAEVRRIARKEAMEAEMAKEEKACEAVKRYIVICMGLLCLTVFTALPLWAVITMAASSGVLLAAYIFRVYYPWEEA